MVDSAALRDNAGPATVKQVCTKDEMYPILPIGSIAS